MKSNTPSPWRVGGPIKTAHIKMVTIFHCENCDCPTPIKEAHLCKGCSRTFCDRCFRTHWTDDLCDDCHNDNVVWDDLAIDDQ